MTAQNQDKKWDQLESILKKFDSLIVAFSGNVDSTFLLAAARQIIGENVISGLFGFNAYFVFITGS